MGKNTNKYIETSAKQSFKLYKSGKQLVTSCLTKMKGWIPFTEREVSTGENSFLKVATLGLGALAGGTLLNNIDASANTVEQNTTAHEKNVSTKTTLNTDTFEIGQVSNTATNENSTSESVSESESISESVSESESTSESVSESESTSESVS
ncbi:KxYKxGKxW signal peptide domain-containing protein, partial [Weissella diestrammenae]